MFFLRFRILHRSLTLMDSFDFLRYCFRCSSKEKDNRGHDGRKACRSSCRNRCVPHIIITRCLVFQQGLQWTLSQTDCNRLQSLVIIHPRTKFIPANCVLHIWINCWHCLLAIRCASSCNDGLLRFIHPQSSYFGSVLLNRITRGLEGSFENCLLLFSKSRRTQFKTQENNVISIF